MGNAEILNSLLLMDKMAHSKASTLCLLMCELNQPAFQSLLLPNGYV
jgi:hypothetical protein